MIGIGKPFSPATGADRPSGYTPCTSSTCDTVSAYEYNEEDKCLNLFFATLKEKHAINGDRIVDHIYLMDDSLGFPNLAEDILKKSIQIRFVFLIPEGSGEFDSQTVTPYTRLSDDAMARERDHVAYAEFVIDHPDLFKPKLLHICKAKVKTFQRKLKHSSKWEMVLKEIPQYYFPIPGTAMYLPSSGYI